MNALVNDDITAALLSEQEVAYRQMLSDAIRNMKEGSDGASFLSTKIPLVGDAVKRGLYGVRPMGYTGPSRSTRLAEELYMMALPGTATTITE
jgi:hypothetical protein